VRTAGRRLNHDAERLLRVDCSMVAIEPSRVTAPFADLTTMSRYSRGSRIWVLVPMVQATLSLSNTPSGPVALALMIARRTSSRLIPIDAIATGLTRTRIVGCFAPLTLASATPFLREIPTGGFTNFRLEVSEAAGSEQRGERHLA
jgi:hypothetical protein